MHRPSVRPSDLSGLLGSLRRPPFDGLTMTPLRPPQKSLGPAPPPLLTAVDGGTVPRGPPREEQKKAVNQRHVYSTSGRVRQSDMPCKQPTRRGTSFWRLQHAFVHKTGPYEHEKGLAGPSQRLIPVTN
ncbi:hypothetical protein LX32DRAFT_281405 [Colletotrichum zoysiae]|uniref:Uncharacterized protein n=1 Tax=Colletotrichum zoysiae TaxID=1216348 RepID=A0AAD9LUK3_9PEZI|nr:hypothetical protein LX32DRAFT_281405 [Colletotrichum zoysiae]